jgi:hypothetical protein
MSKIVRVEALGAAYPDGGYDVTASHGYLLAPLRNSILSRERVDFGAGWPASSFHPAPALRRRKE